MKIIFETERLNIRQYNKADKENFFSLSGNEEVMQYIRPTSSRESSNKILKEYIEAYKTNPGRGRWAVNIRSSGEFVGSFAIIPMPSAPEKTQLGYSLTPEKWGKGFATELTIAGLKYFFETEKVPVIHGITEIPNIASQKVLLKAGFKQAGTIIEEGKELLIFEFTKSDYILKATPV